jgi:ring-1,2-phenylacetyl-CoA epoxidase subunit PaaE
MDDCDGLSEKEIQQGFVLTCMSHPLTSDVVVEIG